MNPARAGNSPGIAEKQGSLPPPFKGMHAAGKEEGAFDRPGDRGPLLAKG